MRTIKVTQSATEKIAPDSTVIEVRLRSEHKKSSEAARELQEKCSAVISALGACGLGADEVKAGSTSVSTVRRDNKTLFCAQTRLKITLPLGDNRADGCIEALDRSGADWSQTYILQSKTYKAELINRAVEAARASAKLLADASGVKLGTLVSIEYAAHDGGMYGIQLMRAAHSGDFSPEPEPIEATETVICEWEIDQTA